MCGVTLLLVLALLSPSVVAQKVEANAEVGISKNGVTASASGSAVSSTSVEKTCACNDEPPKAEKGKKQYTCAEQKDFGQCDADFMLGFCECTCERCCPCNDFPPPGKAFTCAQQKEFGKCGDDFMAGFCECECGRCSALKSTLEEVEVSPASPKPTPPPSDKPTSTPTPKPTPEPAPAKKETPTCIEGTIQIFGQEAGVCESVRCAQNRQKCGNRCGSLAEIKFDCEDKKEGNSAAFSSSCACASK